MGWKANSFFFSLLLAVPDRLLESGTALHDVSTFDFLTSSELREGDPVCIGSGPFLQLAHYITRRDLSLSDYILVIPRQTGAPVGMIHGIRIE